MRRLSRVSLFLLLLMATAYCSAQGGPFTNFDFTGTVVTRYPAGSPFGLVVTPKGAYNIQGNGTATFESELGYQGKDAQGNPTWTPVTGTGVNTGSNGRNNGT